MAVPDQKGWRGWTLVSGSCRKPAKWCPHLTVQRVRYLMGAWPLSSDGQRGCGGGFVGEVSRGASWGILSSRGINI